MTLIQFIKYQSRMKGGNLKQLMQAKALNSSSRQSQEMMRSNYPQNKDAPFNLQYSGVGNNPTWTQTHNQKPYDNYGGATERRVYAPSYKKSREECMQEMDHILTDLDKMDGRINYKVNEHNERLIRTFNEDYDRLAQQIIKNVETQLRENKERMLRELKDRRAGEPVQVKPVKRNIVGLKEEVTVLRNGLDRDNQYKQYVSKIVLKDFEAHMNHINDEIERLNFFRVDLGLDEKYYNCFRSDTNKIIYVRDEQQSSLTNENYSPHSASFSQARFDETNPHTNRDQIKRGQVNGR